jgi:hypothetical protein
MSIHRWFIACVVVLLGGLFPSEARAQMETPSRAFHNSTGFRLEGKHAAVPCASCHINKEYKGTPKTCFECHWIRRKDDRYETRLGTQCEQCHRPISWNAVRWNHASQAGVPLNASHRTLPCQACHKNGYFRSIALQCISCHQKDYNATKSPNHAAAGFPMTCDRCHRPSESSWRTMGGEGFNHASVYPLVGTHATLACQSCHKSNVYRGTPRDCIGCHQADYTRTQNPNHAAAGFPTACETCHRANATQFAGATFNHNSVFQLVGTHATLACQSCHKNNIYRGTPRDCVGCHQNDYNRTQNPNHAAAGFPTTCDACHRPTDPGFRGNGAGGGGGFNHNSVFQLVGTHATLACQSCHRNNVYRGTPRDCVGCHQPDYNRTQNPNHAAAGFPTACETCHRPTDPQWRNSGSGGFNHNSVFPLQGLHATQACASCHKSGVYRGTPRDCVGCHQTNYNNTKNPNHAATGIPTTCESCHRATDSTWTGGSFNHNSFFPLVGVHATQACVACHRSETYRGTPRDCVGCHLALYNATKSPNHAAAGFPTTCETCHRPTDAQWGGNGFNHNAIFQLVGVHASTACESCHKNNVYKGTPRECFGCHQAKYNATKNPNHAAAGFPTSCESCHRPTDSTWTATFNHNAFFQLVGPHASQACATCHKNNVYKGTPRDCVGCHLAKYNAARNPNHQAAGFPTTCESCHRPSDSTWVSTFNHNSVFQLQGVHASQACATCHKNNVYKGTPRDCYGCHQAKYAATKNPPHASAGFSTTCDSCHKPTDAQWTGVTFNHNAIFQLQGVHATTACTNCHKNNVYKGTPRDCIGCHQAKYNATTNPNHAAAGFPTSCETCHKATSSTWTGGTFNHNTVFQLQGVHATTACANCHKNNVYKGTPRDCVGCHQAKYTATTNPNHAAAGFPTSCETCHKATSSTWTGATFSHSFPRTGNHNVACNQCHTTPNNFVVYACTACHERNRADDKHRGVNGYRYDSTACFACHPNGRKP